MDAALKRFVVKVSVGCGIRLWLKASLVIMLKIQGLGGQGTMWLSILTSLFHVAVGTEPYLSALANSRYIKSGKKYWKFFMLFVIYLFPVWATMIRLSGLRLCNSGVFAFSSGGCVSEAEVAHLNVTGATNSTSVYPGDWPCVLNLGMVAGIFLCGSACLTAGGPRVRDRTGRMGAQSKQFERNFATGLILLGIIEFAMVPFFLYLGKNKQVELGRQIIYGLYGLVCIGTFYVAKWIVGLDPASLGTVAWSNMWRIKLKIPCLGCETPIPKALQLFVMDIPAYTDNCMLSLAIGDVETLWTPRLQG